MTRQCTRRTFLAAAAIGAASTYAACRPRAHKRARTMSANQRLNLAFIGLGRQGTLLLNEFPDDVVAAFCDVDDASAAEAYRRFPNVPRYRDFRILFDKQKDIDAVVVATPDHWHAVIASAAMRLGKHVFCEKPLARTIHEARAIAETAKNCGIVTQAGSQGMASPGIRRLREWVEAGVIGAVREVHCWTDRPLWPQGIDRPADAPLPPATLDWDMWLGPAPERPYHPCYLGLNWRGWWDFGTGALGDMGPHVLLMPWVALKLGVPASVTAESSSVNQETAPAWSIIRFEFPARGELPPVTLTWRDGGKVPPRPEGVDPNETLGLDGSGTLFIGDNGMIAIGPYGYGEGPRLVPRDRMRTFAPPAQSLPDAEVSHWREWANACRGGPLPSFPFEQAAAFTETILLGNVALRAGRTVAWDEKQRSLRNPPEADAFLRPVYRGPWRL
ncbi:MAG TPA: Gfo/Idh/MocA family oxidoreductase [Candidatus Hydrogenedentes bacterium]|nr:Gfo/Idh/MocA family oxidoreductase [Candidatus Hydrogenedentota bacterium]